ncbi:MAG: hypothetical protein ACXVAX_06295 [Pseudobdellovibrio sp.]
MFRRTINLIFILFSLQLQAQAVFENGEVNLRGTLIFKNEKNARLVVNAGTRAMKSFALSSSDFSKNIKPYKSGTKVEACVTIKDGAAELVKVRPLAPTEAVFIYGGTIRACPASKGCKNFDKVTEAPLLSDSMSASEAGEDYFSCQK